MKEKISNETYDTKLEPSDWRFSASIVGLIKYFDFHRLEYEILNGESLLYNSSNISEREFLQFVEYYYKGELHHAAVEEMLFYDEFADDIKTRTNDRLSGNTIMKKVFGKLKFDGTNKSEILTLIEDNRFELIKETFRNKNNLYKNYCNTNMLLQEKGDYCRLWGYYIDGPKKGKSISYNFDMGTFVCEDIVEFDFIPFAFQGDRETFFINDNVSIERLINTNGVLANAVSFEMKDNDKGTVDVRRAFFKNMIESATFIDYDVEIITKKRDVEYFESLFVRKKSIRIFKALKHYPNIYKAFCFSYKMNENYYINIQEEVTNSILNLLDVDWLIELFIKGEEQDQKKGKGKKVYEGNYEYLISRLIVVNMKIKGGSMMKDRVKEARICAEKVAIVLPENKLNAYKNKLTSSIVFKDYDRSCQILLQMSNYSNVHFDFAYDLFEDFERNKDLAYTFINSLRKTINSNNDEESVS